EAAAGETTPPLTDGVVVATKLGRDLFTRAALRGRQHNPAAKRQRLRARRPPSPPLQHLALLDREHDLSTSRHNRPQSSSMTMTTSASTAGPCEPATQDTRREGAPRTVPGA